MKKPYVFEQYDDVTTKIDALALRLGVQPEPEDRNDGQFRYLLSVNSGEGGERKYNLLDLIHAVLDKLDAASK